MVIVFVALDSKARVGGALYHHIDAKLAGFHLWHNTITAAEEPGVNLPLEARLAQVDKRLGFGVVYVLFHQLAEVLQETTAQVQVG